MSEISIFGRHMTNDDCSTVRQFFNGRTMREEVWFDRVVEGREHANWTTYHVWDFRDNGQIADANKFRDLGKAQSDYDRRVEEVIALSSEPVFEFIEFNHRRKARGAKAARVACDGEWLWMSKRDIELNIRDFGPRPELLKAIENYR